MEKSSNSASTLKTTTSAESSEIMTSSHPITCKYICDRCIHKDAHLEASAFCKDCQQYLCISCDKTHEREVITKCHAVVRSNYLPRKADEKNKGLVESRQLQINTSVDNFKARTAVFLKEVDIRYPSDENMVNVTAIEILSDGSYIVCDYGNNKIKLFSSQNESISEVGVFSQPGGLALITPTEAVVSLTHDCCLQEVKIKKSCQLILGDKTKTRLAYWRLLRYKEHLIATAWNHLHYSINIIDRKGTVLRCVYKEQIQEKYILHMHHFMSLSTDGQTIYITNENIGCTGILLTGEVIFKYKEPGEMEHWGVCTDTEGCVYTTCIGKSKIVIVSKNGKKLQDLVSHPGARLGCMAYSHTNNKLFVERSNENKLLCYQLKF